MDMPWVAEIASVVVGLIAILTAAVSLSKLNNSLLVKQITQGYQTMAAITANTRAMLVASGKNYASFITRGRRGKRIGWDTGKKYQMGAPGSWPMKYAPPRKGLRGFGDKVRGVFGGAAKGRVAVAPRAGILSKLLPVTRFLGHAVTKLTGPIGWLITALLLLGPGIINGLKDVWGWLKSLITKFDDLVPEWARIGNMWASLKKSFGGLGKNFKWLGDILHGIGRVIGWAVGGVLVAAIMVIAAPLILLGKAIQGLMWVINWLGETIQEMWDNRPAILGGGGGGGGGEEAISTYAEGPTLRVSLDREPINIQELRQAAHAETVLRNKQTQDQLAAMNTKLSEALTEAKEQRDTLEVANAQRETANAQRAQGQSAPETRPRDRNGRSPG